MFPGVTLYRNELGGTVVAVCGTPDTEFHFTTAFAFLTESRKAQFAEILKEKPCVNSIEEGVALLDKLNGAINGNSVSESGFNLDEVLNPGNELDLESLCKELGVMD